LPEANAGFLIVASSMGGCVKRVLLAAALLGAVSCSDSSGPNTFGTVSFTYTGAGGGTFIASGNAPEFFAPSTTTSWAVGFFEGSEGQVAGSKPRSGGLVDVALLRFQRTTPGEASIDTDCDVEGTDACNGMVFFLDFNGDGDTGEFFCGLTAGTIVISDVTNGRMTGTFSGTGVCIDEGNVETDFTVSNGEFDVALIAPPG
jgi:hypothetical protein